MSRGQEKFYETRPGLDSVRYLFTYGLVTWLSKQHRDHRFFLEGSSNIDRHIMSDGYFEKGVLDALRAVIEKSGHKRIMIDVGANIGNHTVALADLFDRVESVEPHPVMFRILEANILKNHLRHATAHNFGLADEDTTATLSNPAESHGAARVKERSMLAEERAGRTAEQWDEEFAIELKSATDFVSSFGDVLNEGFIKVDVEGMEQEIVTAILPVLKKYKPIVGFEWFTESQPEIGRMALEALDGYELWGIRSMDVVGPSLARRAARLLVKGREMRLDPVDLANPAPVYTLALLVPQGKLD